ncbi:MAG: aminopeptidase P family protein [Oscillospiraceae bacterium]|nr:aminopeptidase P family protein [Oscillospiraceae bacterium]
MQRRIECLREKLHDNEAVFISGYPNIFYYSGFTSGDAYLLISHDAEYIITDSRYTIQAHHEAKGFEVIDIKEGFEKIFSKTSAKYIGYEENLMSVKEYKKLRMKLMEYQDFVEMSKLIDEQRMIKDSTEIKKIAQAEEIGDEAFSYILDRIDVGRTEREIALELEFFMKKQGASALSFDTIAASGVRSAMPHGTASDKKIEKGDFLTLDFGCVYEGYCSDMTRTVVIGTASAKQKEIYDIVLCAQKAAIDAVKTGVQCNKIDETARNIITEAGYGNNFGHGLGHSVGIEIHENPSFSPKCNEVVQNGHVITVEPGIYIEGFGGVRIEDLIAVQNDEVINLTNSPKELIEL